MCSLPSLSSLLLFIDACSASAGKLEHNRCEQDRVSKLTVLQRHNQKQVGAPVKKQLV